jgi:hypothetical protein
MMKKILKWMKRNTGLVIVLLLTLVLLVFVTVIFIKLLIGNSSDKYGNRLDGIEEVTISNETYDSVKEELMATEKVVEVNTRLQGKIVYVTIVLNENTSRDEAKNIASSTLDNFTEEERGFYDFSYFLKWEGEEGDTVITGNRHHDLDGITWVNS